MKIMVESSSSHSTIAFLSPPQLNSYSWCQESQLALKGSEAFNSWQVWWTVEWMLKIHICSRNSCRRLLPPAAAPKCYKVELLVPWHGKTEGSSKKSEIGPSKASSPLVKVKTTCFILVYSIVTKYIFFFFFFSFSHGGKAVEVLQTS